MKAWPPLVCLLFCTTKHTTHARETLSQANTQTHAVHTHPHSTCTCMDTHTQADTHKHKRTGLHAQPHTLVPVVVGASTSKLGYHHDNDGDEQTSHES